MSTRNKAVPSGPEKSNSSTILRGHKSSLVERRNTGRYFNTYVVLEGWSGNTHL